MTILELARTTPRPGHVERMPAQTPVLEVSVFGPLVIRRGETVLGANDLGGPKPRQVLEILLLNFGSAVSKTRLMDLLWGEKHPAVALPTLESYVSVLRRYLQPGAGRTGPLRTVTGGYVIDRSLVNLDLDRFEVLLKQAGAAAPAAALGFLSEALDIASAPLLGDELLPAWAEEERDMHAARVGLARVMAAEAALAVGETEMAISWGGAATVDDPLNERAWTALILGLEGSGQNTEALRAFDRYRSILDEELGCAPGRALQEAQTRLLTRTASGAPGAGRGPVPTSTEKDAPAAPGAVSLETERLRILIADDHTTFSDLLAGALDREPDLKSIGAATSVQSAVTLVHQLQPDVVLMDLHLAGGSGLEAAELILAEAPGTRIVMLTGNPTQEALQNAARIGVCGFLPKDGSLSVVLDTLRHAHFGNMILHPSLVTRLGARTVSATEAAA